MTTSNEKALLSLFSAIVKRNLDNIQELKNGKILFNILETIIPISTGKYSDVSLKSVHLKLENHFNTTFNYIDIDKALEGDNVEIEKIATLVLVAGVLSDCVQDFMDPIRTFNDDTKNTIKKMLNQAIQPNMDLESLSTKTNSNKNKTFFKEVDITSPSSTNDFKLAALISPTVNPFTPNKDISFNSKMLQTEERLDILSFKLKTEKQLRCNIEEEIYRKESEIDKRVTQIKELSDLLKESELRHQRVVKNLKSEIFSLQEDLRISDKELMDSKNREKRLENELTELKKINCSLESHNNALSQEISSMKEACEKHENKLQELSTALSTAQSTEHQLSVKEHELKEKSQEIVKLNEELHVLRVESQHEMEILKSKLHELQDKLNKSMEEGECWGDVVEMKLNDDIENLQTQLQKQCELLGACEKDKLQFKLTLHQLEQDFNDLKSSFEDKDRELTMMARQKENLLVEKKNLNDQITGLKDELDNKVTEILKKEKFLFEEKEILNKNIAKLKEEVSALEKKNENERQSYCQIENQLKQTKVDYEQLEITNNSLKDEQKAKDNELAATMHQCARHLSEKECLTEEITNLKIQVNDLVAKEKILLVEKESMDAKISEMKTNISNLEKKNVEQETSYCHLEKRLDDFKDQLVTLESKNKVLKEEKEVKENKLSAISQQNKILCTEKQNLNEEITILKVEYDEKITELNKKGAFWLEEKRQMNTDITKLKEEFAKLKQKIALQQTSHDEIERELQESAANMAVLVNEHEALKREKEVKDEELHLVGQQNQTLLNEVQKLRYQIINLKEEYEAKIVESEGKEEKLLKEKELMTVEINNMRVELTKFEQNSIDQQNSYSEIEEQLKLSKARIVILENHNETLKQENDSKGEELSTFIQQKENLLSEKQNLNEQLLSLKEEFASLEKAYVDQQTSYCDLEKQLSIVKDQVDALESNNVVLKGENKVKDDEVLMIIAQKNFILTENQNLNEQLNSLKEKHDEQISELIKKEEDLLEEKNILNLRLTELKDEVSRFEEKSVVQKKSCGMVEEELKQTKAEMDTIEKNYNTLKQEKDLIEVELTANCQENKKLLSEKKNLIEKITSLKLASEEKIIDLERREKSLLEDKEIMNVDMNKLKDIVLTLEKKNADEETSNIAAIEQIKQLQTEVVTLQTKNKLLQEQLHQDAKNMDSLLKTQQKDKEIMDIKLAELMENGGRMASENNDLLKKVISMQEVELKLREELNVSSKKQQELYVSKEGLEKSTLELNSRVERLKELHERKMDEKMKNEEKWNAERKSMKEMISSLELTNSKMKSDFNKLKKEKTKLEKNNEAEQKSCIEIKKLLNLTKTQLTKLEDENKQLKEQRDDLVIIELEAIKNDNEKLTLELNRVKSKELQLIDEAETQKIRIEEFKKRENLMFSYMDDIKKSMEYKDIKLTQTKEFFESLDGKNRMVCNPKDEEIDSVKKTSQVLKSPSEEGNELTDSLQKAKKLVSNVRSISSQQEGIVKQTSLPELNSVKGQKMLGKKPTTKASVASRRLTRAVVRKDGSWNNYGAPITLPSQDIPVVTYTSKTRPPVQAIVQKQVVDRPVFSLPESHESLKPQQALPEGYRALFPCEDEPEDFEWGQLEKQTLQPPNSLFKVPTIENIPKKTTRSQDSRIRRDTFCLKRVPEEQNSEGRYKEILRRNSFYLPHLKSTYPLEELHVSETEVQKLLVSQVDPQDNCHDNPAYVTRGETFRQAVKKIKQSPLKRSRKSSLDSPIVKISKRNSQVHHLEENVAKKSKGRQLKNLFSSTPKKSKSSENANSEKADKLNQDNVAFDISFTPKKVIQRVFKRNNKKKPLEETTDN